VVSRKAQILNPQSSTFEIDLELVESPQNIAVGVFGDAVISTNKSTSVWKVPYEALLDGNRNEGFVFVTEDNQTASIEPVKIHSLAKNDVLLKSDFKKGWKVITSGSAYLKDGSSIEIIK